MENVSIIVPIYNMEEYLKRCLDALISQTYKHLEIILVSDGSTDNSLNICKEYKKNDERIVVIDKKNGGVSSARNKGLEVATGKYIMFVDPDDWIDQNVVEVCMNFAKRYSVDIVSFSYIKEFENSSIKVNVFEEEKLYEYDDIRNKVYPRFFGLSEKLLSNPEKNDQFSPVWGKLYRRELLKKLEFIDIKEIGAEDTWYNIQVFKNVKSMYYSNSIYYHYNKCNDNSITKTYNEQLITRRKKLYAYMQNYINENKLQNICEVALKNRIIIEIFVLALNVVNSNLSIINKYKKIKSILKDDIYIEYFKNFDFKNLNVIWKIYYYASKKRIAIIVLFMTIFAKELRKYRK